MNHEQALNELGRAVDLLRSGTPKEVREFLARVDPNGEKLAFRIRNRREELGLQLTALAKAADVTKGYLSGIEHGKHDPSAAIIDRLARVLDVTCDYLIRGTPAPTRPPTPTGGEP